MTLPLEVEFLPVVCDLVQRRFDPEAPNQIRSRIRYQSALRV